MSVALLTLPAMRGSIVLGNPSWLLSHSVFPTIQKIPRKMGEKSPSCPVPSDTQPSGAPARIPRGAVNLEDSQPSKAPAFVRTSPPTVQQCPLPPATAFPHPQWFNCRVAPETPELCLTSAHLPWARTHGDGPAWRTPAVRAQQGCGGVTAFQRV